MPASRRREVEVLELLGETDTAAQMAHRLSVSVRTVESHLAHAYRKLGVRSREDAIAEFASLEGRHNRPSLSLVVVGHPRRYGEEIRTVPAELPYA